MSERRVPEAQFQLANERTYLAWLRTALALVASGVAAARLLAGQTLHWAWETVGILLILAGVVTAALARRRWRAMDAAIREGEPLPAPGIAVMIAGVIVICGLITTALLLGTNPGHVLSDEVLPAAPERLDVLPIFELVGLVTTRNETTAEETESARRR